MITPIRFHLNLLTLATRRELADIYKLINNKIDSPFRPNLLKCISFNVSAYNNLTTFMLYLSSHSTNYLTYSDSPIPKAMFLYNKLSGVQFFLYSIKA